MKQVLKKMLFVFLGIVAVALVLFVILYFNMIRTFFSVKQISDAPAYYVHIYGDFWFDEYLDKGETSSDKLEDFLYGKLTFGLYKPNSDQSHGCSGFFAKTPDGDYILAQDLDTPNPHMPIIAEYELNKKIYAIADMKDITNSTDKMTAVNKVLSYATPYVTRNGMNEDGLAITVATAGGSYYINQPDKISLLQSTLITAVLANASNVEEAVAFLEQYNVVLDSPALSHYMIADAGGNCAVVEWAKGSMQVLKCEVNYQIMSNFVLYDNPEHVGFGSDRYLAYDEYLSECKGVLNENDAMKMLIANTIKGDEDWSVVYNLTKRTVSVCFYGDYENTYTYSY